MVNDSSFCLVDKVLPIIQLLKKLSLIEESINPSIVAHQDDGPIHYLSKANKLKVEEQQAINLLSTRLDIPFVNLNDREVIEKIIIKDFAEKISPEFCLKNKVAPLFRKGDQVFTVFANPLDTEALKALEFSLDESVEIAIASESQIIELLHKNFDFSKSQFDDMVIEDSETPAVQIMSNLEQEQELDGNFAAPPIIKLINKIITDSIHKNASDIHFEPSESGLEVRCRIDGIMRHVMEAPVRLRPHMISRIKLIAGMDIAEKRKPQDGRLRVKLNQNSVDIRASSIPAAFGEKIVLRLLGGELHKKSFGDLGMPKKIEEGLIDHLSQAGRMILVTGPTGSGKTTTLYSSINYLNNGTNSIGTVEDPVEYRIPGISQIQVNEQVDVTFHSALRSVLRQDPDVILVGEIRDPETAQTAMRAAQTGHLVLSTLHTNNAPEAIARLLDLEVEPFVVGTALAAVLAQRLVRKVCPNCVAPASLESIDNYLNLIETYNIDVTKLVEGRGCPKCDNTGYKGRMGIYSYLNISQAISNLIFEEAPLSDIIEQAHKEGFIDIDEMSIDLINKGVTSLKEIRPYLHHQETKSELGLPSVSLTPEPVTVIQAQPTAFIEPSIKAGGAPRKQTVLFIDDDENIRDIYSEVLKMNLYDVITAKNGLDGLNKLYESVPDIIVVDYMMPQMDGKAFIQRLKSDQQTKEIPVILLTAAGSDDREADLLSLGIDDFVSKTVSPKIFLARLKNALN